MVSSATPINGATIGDLIRLHRSDYKELGRALGRSKQFTLEKLEVTLGHLRRDDLTRERLIAFAKTRKKEGAGPVTIGMDFSYLRTVILHAAALHGIEVSVEQIGLARAALNMVGLIGKAKERDRRPTEDEIERICDMIMVTKYPHQPKNITEQIICDADLDYLGRDDFFKIANSLFKELSANGSI